MAFLDSCEWGGSGRLLRGHQATHGSVPSKPSNEAHLILLADLGTMEHKLNTNKYQNLKAFLDDAQLIFDNCRLYNPEGSIYVKHVAKLEKFMKELVADYEKRVA